jgi:hypothetical protein
MRVSPLRRLEYIADLPEQMQEVPRRDRDRPARRDRRRMCSTLRLIVLSVSSA